MTDDGKRAAPKKPASFAERLAAELQSTAPAPVLQPAPPPRWFLLAIEGAHAGELFELTGDSMLLGRDASRCEIFIEGDGVARIHTLFERRPDGWHFADQRTTAGGFRNHKRDDGGLLHVNDVLQMGSSTRLRFIDQAEADALPPLEVRRGDDRLTGALHRRVFAPS